MVAETGLMLCAGLMASFLQILFPFACPGSNTILTFFRHVITNSELEFWLVTFFMSASLLLFWIKLVEFVDVSLGTRLPF